MYDGKPLVELTVGSKTYWIDDPEGVKKVHAAVKLLAQLTVDILQKTDGA